MFDFITPGRAAAVLLANTLVWKLYMALVWRLGKISQARTKEEIANIKASSRVVNDSSAQLNEAEWTPPLLAALLFLAVRGASAPVASGLAVYGSVAYPVLRILVSNRLAPLGSIPRFVALGMLTLAVYNAL